MPNPGQSGMEQWWKQIWKVFFPLEYLLLSVLAIRTCFYPAIAVISQRDKKKGAGIQMLRNALNLSSLM